MTANKLAEVEQAVKNAVGVIIPIPIEQERAAVLEIMSELRPAISRLLVAAYHNGMIAGIASANGAKQ